jgi:hypothetical protein
MPDPKRATRTTEGKNMKQNRSQLTVLVGMVAMGALADANATILYDTAGAYFIDTTVNENVRVENADAHLVIGNGGVVRGVAGGGPFPGAVRTRLGSLEVVGDGRIIAGGNLNALDMTSTGALVTLRDHAAITGNIYSGSPGYGSESSGAARLFIQDHAVVNGNLTYGGFVRIQDQALILGNVSGQGFTNLNLELWGGTAWMVIGLR